MNCVLVDECINTSEAHKTINNATILLPIPITHQYLSLNKQHCTALYGQAELILFII